MARFRDNAVCIRLIDWSETSQIVALLTEEHGQVRGVAKGSKRTSPSSVARYSGGIELLTLGEVVGIIKPTADLATLTEWDLQQPHWHLRRDLRAQEFGLYAADLAGAMLADHDAHPRAFTALVTLLRELADAATRDAALLRFQWELLDDCGYRPELEADVRSGEPLTDDPDDHLLFDARRGGLARAGSPNGPGETGAIGGMRNATSWPTLPGTITALRRLADPNDRSPTDPTDTRRANRLLCTYARAILDRQLPTMQAILSTTEPPTPVGGPP